LRHAIPHPLSIRKFETGDNGLSDAWLAHSTTNREGMQAAKPSAPESGKHCACAVSGTDILLAISGPSHRSSKNDITPQANQYVPENYSALESLSQTRHKASEEWIPIGQTFGWTNASFTAILA
jgi:hypothetical protein